MTLPLLAIQLTEGETRTLVLVLLATTLGALLSRVHRRIVLPTVVLEIVLGIVIGPQVLDIASVFSVLAILSNFGLAFLFFFAGLEVVEQRVERRAVQRGTIGWGISLGIGLVVGGLLQWSGLDATWWLVGVALCTTSLGTLVPILADARLLGSRSGSAVLGTGVCGEFWPIVFISIFLTSVYGAVTEALLLVVFGALVFGAAVVVLRARPPVVVRVLRETVETTGQAAVRASLLLVAALVYLARESGFDFVLGAFAAGLVVGVVIDSPGGRAVRLRLEGIGFGFLIPIYFVVTGMTFDLDGLLSPSGLGLAALFLALLLVVRGAPALLSARELPRRETACLALCGATALPLIVAIVGIGTERGAISTGVGASLIGAGMISVLVFPLLAVRLVGATGPAEDAAAVYAEV